MATKPIGAVLVIGSDLYGRIERSLRVHRAYTTIVTFDGPRRVLAVALFSGTVLFAAILQSAGHGVTGGRRIRVHSIVPLNIPAAALSGHLRRIETADANKIVAALAQDGILAGSSWTLFWEFLKSRSTARRDLEELERKVKAAHEPQDNQAKEVYHLERDALGLASELAGFDRKSILAEVPSSLPIEPNPEILKFAQKSAIEDTCISYDVTKFPGLDRLHESPSGVATFTNKKGEQLHVVNVNRTQRETATGVDLVYLADSFESTILVQYKMFNVNNDPTTKSPKAAYRLIERDKEQYRKMLAVQGALQARGDRMGVRDYRLGPECVFYKLCHRCEPETPSDLVPGIYFSVEHWRRLLEDPRSIGSRGADVIGYETADRYLSNTEFIALVRGGWIGARDTPVGRLEDIIESLLKDNRSITIARKSRRVPVVSRSESPDQFQLPNVDSGKRPSRRRKTP